MWDTLLHMFRPTSTVISNATKKPSLNNIQISMKKRKAHIFKCSRTSPCRNTECEEQFMNGEMFNTSVYVPRRTNEAIFQNI